MREPATVELSFAYFSSSTARFTPGTTVELEEWYTWRGDGLSGSGGFALVDAPGAEVIAWLTYQPVIRVPDEEIAFTIQSTVDPQTRLEVEVVSAAAIDGVEVTHSGPRWKLRPLVGGVAFTDAEIEFEVVVSPGCELGYSGVSWPEETFAKEFELSGEGPCHGTVTLPEARGGEGLVVELTQ